MNDRELSKSVKIGTTFILTYIASYYMRNMLSVSSPAMLETGKYTKEFLGTLSAVYMIVYAAGQFINGPVGDKLKPKTMIVSGLVFSGLSAILFPYCSLKSAKIICFGVLGYSLSMLRGPMMKVISENTKSNHARVICAFFASSSFIGSFVAGLFAMINNYHYAFVAAGIGILLIAVMAYTVITYLEKKKLINVLQSEIKRTNNIFSVFKAENFIFYMFIAMLVEIAGSSISFWIPTYLTEHMQFDKNTANMLFVVRSLVISAAPFVAVWLFGYIKNDIKIVGNSFMVSALFFFGMLFVKNPWANFALFTAALLFSSFASAMIYSVYIPSLKKTGKVSSANGILDGTGYIGAAISNFVFSRLMERLSWNGVICIWAAFMLSGGVLAVIKRILKKQ